MSNPTAVPLGESVTIASGYRTNLGKLLDCNNATYNIKSGSSWHLLYIKATQSGQGWTFSLLSDKVEDVAKLYNPEEGEGQLPKFVCTDNDGGNGRQVLPYVLKPPHEVIQGFPTFDEQVREVASSLESDMYINTADSLEPTTDNWNKGKIEYDNQLIQLTTLRETGVHIYQIAYHRIVAGTPTTAEIVQIARSDFHFWPIPVLPVWSRYDNLKAFVLDNCGA